MEHNTSTKRNRVIIVAGYDCSGKSTFARRIASPIDVILEAGAVVRAALGLPRGPDLSQRYTDHLDHLNQRIILEVASVRADLLSPESAVIIVGVRSISLFMELIAQYPEAISIFVDAPRQMRYLRHITDRRLAAPLSYRAFAANDQTQRIWGIEQVRRAATYVLRLN